MGPTDFHKTIQSSIKLQDNITIVDDISQFKIETVTNGIIMVWVEWSIGYMNCKCAIEYLQDKNYQGHIYIMDADSIQADFQKNVLKARLNGWGEIFIIKSGQVIESFLGKESWLAFKTYIGKLADIK